MIMLLIKNIILINKLNNVIISRLEIKFSFYIIEHKATLDLGMLKVLLSYNNCLIEEGH